MHRIVLHGEYDISRADDLRAELARAIDAHEAIEVDVTDALLLDAAILGVLLGAYQRAEAAGADFVLLLGPETCDSVRRTFAATGLDRVFPIVTASSAVATAA